MNAFSISNPPELLYQLALTQVPGIGDVAGRMLVQALGTASAVFKAKQSTLEKIEGIGAFRARAVKQFDGFAELETELEFIDKYKITPLFITDADYPQKLLHCYDAPLLLFYRGTANLNTDKMIAVVGTRSATDYGRNFTETLIAELAASGITITSGLAFGIDAAAHRAAIKNGLPTVAVVGHGLAKIYPPEHAGLAREMIGGSGGLLTEFFSNTKPDKHNFPLRNRIVAGICDATVVIETAIKGGSMITAKLADGYNRDVFALPGRTTDKNSTGCNYLIRHNKAAVITSATDLLETMGWKPVKKERKVQRSLFLNLTADEQLLCKILGAKEAVGIDELNGSSGLTSSAVAASLLSLELQGVVQSMPGKMYGLV